MAEQQQEIADRQEIFAAAAEEGKDELLAELDELEAEDIEAEMAAMNVAAAPISEPAAGIAQPAAAQSAPQEEAKQSADLMAMMM